MCAFKSTSPFSSCQLLSLTSLRCAPCPREDALPASPAGHALALGSALLPRPSCISAHLLTLFDRSFILHILSQLRVLIDVVIQRTSLSLSFLYCRPLTSIKEWNPALSLRRSILQLLGIGWLYHLDKGKRGWMGWDSLNLYHVEGHHGGLLGFAASHLLCCSA